MTSVPSTSSTTAPPTSSCAVCGDVFHSRQYGVPSCLGCVIFFRRSVINKSQYKCWKNGKCVIDYGSRCSCRACRLRKCFHVGMEPRAIQQRDRLGPRNPKPILPIFSESETWVDVSNPTSGSPSANHFLNHLIHLQQNQRSRHKKLHKNYSNPPIGDKKNHATPADINLTVKLGMKDADEWGKQFEAYRVLNQKEKKSVLSEYGILFLLIDLGFKTSQEADDEGHWLLQNGKTLEVAVSSKNPSVNHFVSELINTISIPFQTLKIDDFECAVLKALLLLNCSFPNCVVLKNVMELQNSLFLQLMEHSTKKIPTRGPERFGEVVLLMSSIRNAMKSFYNQTRVPGLFYHTSFEPFLRNILLS